MLHRQTDRRRLRQTDYDVLFLCTACCPFVCVAFALLCNFVVAPQLLLLLLPVDVPFVVVVYLLLQQLLLLLVAGVAACGKAFVAAVAAGKNVYLFCLFLHFYVRYA